MSKSNRLRNDSSISVSVVFRHTEPTEALKRYAEDKLMSKVRKYIHTSGDLHIVLSVEKLDHFAEAHLTSKSVDTIAKVRTDNMYSAIDKLASTLEGQLRKMKGKSMSGRHQTLEHAAMA